MFYKQASFLTLSLFLGTALSAQECPHVQGLQAYRTTPQDGKADGRFNSCDSFFDSPKVHGSNASSYDWWYFDAIGTDGLSSLAVAFFIEANQSGFSVTENFTNWTSFRSLVLFPTVLASATSCLPTMQSCPPTVTDPAGCGMVQVSLGLVVRIFTIMS